MALERAINPMQDAVKRGMTEKRFRFAKSFRSIYKLNSMAKEFLCEGGFVEVFTPTAG